MSSTSHDGTSPAVRIDDVAWDTPAGRAALAIRMQVFVGEQGVPAGEEADGRDATAHHVLVVVDGTPAATGRLVVDGRWGIVGRMAVLASHRRMGLGTRVLDRLTAIARSRGLEGIVLHAQGHAAGFYRRMGFVEEGQGYLEVGIPHVTMRRTL